MAEAVRVAVAADPLTVPVLRRFRAVEVCDGSVITLPAALAPVWAGCGTAPVPTAAALKLLVRMDLCRGLLRGPVLADGRTHDRAAAQELAPIPVGGLHIGDLGFFALDQLASWNRSGRFWLSRLKRGTVVAGPDGTRWDLPVWLAAHCPRQVAVPIRLGAHHRLRCRLLAERVPATVAAARRAKLQAAAQREGQAVSAEEWTLAAWTVLVTNCAPEQLSLAEGLALEQARWQVELLFKRWKSLGQVDEWRSAQPWRILCEVYVKLLVLVLQHWLLVVGCWANADRSLWRGVRTLQRRGHSLAAAWAWGAWSAAVAEAVAAVARCRIDKRKSQPSTYQVLLAASPVLAQATYRDLLLLDLPPPVVATVPRSADPRADLAAIIAHVAAWGALDDTTPALAVLLENAAEILPPSVAAHLAPIREEVRTTILPEVDYVARFQQVIAAVERGDWAAVPVIAAALPPDYPGLAPLVQRPPTPA